MKEIKKAKPNSQIDPYNEELAVGQEFLEINNGHHVRISKITGDKVSVDYKYGDKWHHYGQPDRREFTGPNARYIRMIGSFDDEWKRAVQIFHDSSAYEEEQEDTPEDTTTTALSQHAQTKDQVNMEIARLDRMNKELSKARLLIEMRRQQLHNYMTTMQKKMRQLQKIVDAIEIYLGIHQEMLQLTEGMPSDKPIYIFQQILYMDEEVGDPRMRHGHLGIDFKSIDDFDTWLLEGNNLDKIIPMDKGIVVVRPSRQKREYSNDPLVNALMNDNNSMAYLLIRNGDNIYRIWTDLHMGERFFPTMHEIQKTWEELDATPWESDKEKLNEIEYTYKRNALIIQGLLDRTDIFAPMSHPINIFKPSTYEDESLILIRDDEMTLPTGRKPFKQWLADMNAQIAEGSRILITDLGVNSQTYYNSRKDWNHRFVRYYQNDWAYPALPNKGIYSVQMVEDTQWDNYSGKREHKKFPCISYRPSDEAQFGSGWEWDPHPRKRNSRFVIEPTRDMWLVNYDLITIEDIDYYLTSRVDRKDYLNSIPLLQAVREMLLEEKEKESHFVKLVANRMNCTEEVVWEAVDWWKLKNKWKRGIHQDDAKALRMIEKRIRKEL